ncbi:RNA-directed DNA polymerase from mobile element jockey-like [Brachionus plicatilis]|uniref:RNA-directed DNA polymerase from mobile element jockey-like n=1 Tax=Brachionus plicatilis TaxID=10195 RepID=A0A3M7QZ52_BRAPC|nr:RNA-directed DNA polymerase from mobile element jockey-like [Brachionus plicatilis]
MFYSTRKDRGGGGVCIYVREAIKSYEVEDEILRSDSVEQYWCSIVTGHQNLKTTIEYLSRSRGFSGLLIAGDFNMPTISWNGLYFGLNEESFERKFLDTIDDCFYHQHVTFPTFQSNDGDFGNILDLVITEESSRIYSIERESPLGSLNRAHLSLSWTYELKGNAESAFRSTSFRLDKDF